MNQVDFLLKELTPGGGGAWSAPPVFNIEDIHVAVPPSELVALKNEIAGLRSEIRDLTVALRESLIERPLVHREEVSLEMAKREVAAVLQASEQEIYPSEISEQTRIPYELVEQALAELEAEGSVEKR